MRKYISLNYVSGILIILLTIASCSKEETEKPVVNLNQPTEYYGYWQHSWNPEVFFLQKGYLKRYVSGHEDPYLNNWEIMEETDEQGDPVITMVIIQKNGTRDYRILTDKTEESMKLNGYLYLKVSSL